MDEAGEMPVPGFLSISLGPAFSHWVNAAEITHFDPLIESTTQRRNNVGRLYVDGFSAFQYSGIVSVRSCLCLLLARRAVSAKDQIIFPRLKFEHRGGCAEGYTDWRRGSNSPFELGGRLAVIFWDTWFDSWSSSALLL